MTANDPAELSLCSNGVNRLKMSFALPFLKGKRVLDVGCGNGLYGLELSESGFDVLQLDIADRRAAAACGLPFTQFDAEELDKLRVPPFDTILAFDIIEHLNDDKKFLKSLREICHGNLVLSVPNIDSCGLEQVGLAHVHHTDKTHRREYSAASLESLLTDCGWTPCAIVPHFNRNIPYFARLLRSETVASHWAARAITLQCVILTKLGIFQNNCVGDWFCAAK